MLTMTYKFLPSRRGRGEEKEEDEESIFGLEGVCYHTLSR
jgi:hypothetical protein